MVTVLLDLGVQSGDPLLERVLVSIQHNHKVRPYLAILVFLHHRVVLLLLAFLEFCVHRHLPLLPGVEQVLQLGVGLRVAIQDVALQLAVIHQQPTLEYPLEHLI